MNAQELSELIGVAHSTVALRLRKAGVAPVATEGARELYDCAVAIAALLR